MASRPPIAIIRDIVRQHAEESAFLHVLRTSLTRAPAGKLQVLGDFDERLAAHLDGLAAAGEDAWPFCEAALESPTPGTVFTAAIRAIEARQERRLEKVFALAETVVETRPGLLAAFGWLPRNQLQGVVAPYLSSEHAFARWVGISACAMHRVNGTLQGRGLQDANAIVRARALRSVGELGLGDALPASRAAASDTSSEARFWGAWSGVLLGDRGSDLAVLTSTATADGPHKLRAFRLVFQTVGPSPAHKLLKMLADDPLQRRWLIRGSGIAGDPHYVPWLINHMRDDALARLAGEAFTLITGADLSGLNLERPQPEDFQSGPTDNPDDDNVDMDPDDGLPWPDPETVEKWWAANAARFHKGTRYFVGAPVTRAHCVDVLKHGYQRQRVLAAHYLCLLDPGTPLFNTSAPAWRQQRLLSRL